MPSESGQQSINQQSITVKMPSIYRLNTECQYHACWSDVSQYRMVDWLAATVSHTGHNNNNNTCHHRIFHRFRLWMGLSHVILGHEYASLSSLSLGLMSLLVDYFLIGLRRCHHIVATLLMGLFCLPYNNNIVTSFTSLPGHFHATRFVVNINHQSFRRHHATLH